MQVSGESGNSHLAHVARTRYRDSLYHNDNVPCEGRVHMQDAFIEWGSKAERYRPCVVMTGQVESVRAEPGVMPFGVTRINFDPDKQPSVTYRYQLDNQELSELALKGLFGTLDENGQVQDTQFTCPEIFMTAPFELPMSGKVMALPPEQETDAPVVFFSINTPHALDTCSAQSGYENLADYFNTMLQYIPKETLGYDASLTNVREASFEQPDFSRMAAPGFKDIDDIQQASALDFESYIGQEKDQAAEFAEAMEMAAREEAAEEAMRMEQETPEEHAERVTLEAASRRISERVDLALRSRTGAAKRLVADLGIDAGNTFDTPFAGEVQSSGDIPEPDGDDVPEIGFGDADGFEDIGGDEPEDPGVPIGEWNKAHDADEEEAEQAAAGAVGPKAGEGEIESDGLPEQDVERPVKPAVDTPASDKISDGEVPGQSEAVEDGSETNAPAETAEFDEAAGEPVEPAESEMSDDALREKKERERRAAEQNRYENDIDDAVQPGVKRTIPARFEELAREAEAIQSASMDEYGV